MRLTFHQDLVQHSTFFSRLLEEYGSHDEQDTAHCVEERYEVAAENEEVPQKPDTTLMQAEERVTGSVATSMYTRYLRHAGGIFWGLVICMLLLLVQGAQGQ